MEIDQVIQKHKMNAIFGFPLEKERQVIGIPNKYNEISTYDYILKKTKCNEDRLLSSLEIVHLKKDISNQNMNTLSSSEQIKVELAIQLIENREEILLYKFDAYFMNKELLFFKNLFRKLTTKYKKTIVFIDSNVSFLIDFVDYFVINSSNKGVQIFYNDDFYNDALEELLEIPPIISFGKYVNKNKKYIGKHKTIAELIKAIYREV